MKRVLSMFTLFLALPAVNLFAQPHFAVYDLYNNTDGEPLAAYQVKIKALSGNVKIVSIEGGEHFAFKDAPYFDPKAIQNATVKLAAFSTASASDLPEKRTRVVSIHIHVDGPGKVTFNLILQTAATV